MKNFIRDKIVYPWKDLKYCINNLFKWRKIICNDRWWDYAFLLELLKFKLEDMNYFWGRHTHYVGDYDDKKILEELIEDINFLIEYDGEPEKEKEYKKVSNRFWSKLGRHYQKFWD